MTDHLESARTALSVFEREPSTQSEHRLADALAAILSHLESLGKPPTSELDELRGKLAAAEALVVQTVEERDFFDAERCKVALAHDELADKLAASEQAREGMKAVVEAAKAWRFQHANPPSFYHGDTVMFTDADADLMIAVDALASPPAKEEAKPQSHILRCCRGCGAILQTENLTMADGCPCNSARGVNHGIVPTDVCTCDACDPQQSGSSRRRTHIAPPVAAPSPAPAAPPQAETGGGALTAFGALCEEAEEDIKNASRGLYEEPDAATCPIWEAPEHAWRKAWTLVIGCAVRRLQLGGYNKIIRNLISDVAPLPYEPPGAK